MTLVGKVRRLHMRSDLTMYTVSQKATFPRNHGGAGWSARMYVHFAISQRSAGRVCTWRERLVEVPSAHWLATLIACF